ncbi:hypothetical protein LPJ63_001778 [Coemansia sp. RSA 2711]|nr:hypothetical protein LPJ63_001778 [Coemansia sp. RSA 2711]KAJ2315824.1 hypothetical protein IWW52_003965 [Coemansia sp. RSA 2704]KAJ2322878.1 hypothetical protein IWW51_004021 [Coemansia sp. RSA 2702]KAJ2732473.1 hypothetical protein H4R23_002838 [Coemansia sp. Cherry 401B]
MRRLVTDVDPNSQPAPNPAKRTPKRAEPVVLNDDDIEEKHVRGWGNGGQKLNKTSSCVQLLHKPTGTMVVCQDTRSLQQNRKLAFKRLREKLDLQLNGADSKIGRRIEKLKRRKHKQRQRAKKKYGQVRENTEESCED